jgi:hypothetical protein
VSTVRIASTLVTDVILSVYDRQMLLSISGQIPSSSATIAGFGSGQKRNPGPFGMGFTDVDTAFWTQWLSANPTSPLLTCIFPVS